VEGADLAVGDGELFAILGPSGSGKTTVLRMVAGFEQPTAGTIRLGGTDVTALPARRRDVNTVFQEYALFPHMTVAQNVEYGLKVKGVPGDKRRKRTSDALDMVRLSGEASRKPAQLSGGQRQRVAIARATIVPPEVLLCDEPTSALDVSLAATVLNLLGRIRRELGMAMLFVTHDLGAARVVADRIAVMYLGRIVEVGPAADIAASPKHPYTRALLSAVPAAGVVHSKLEGEPASPLHPPSGCAFHPRCAVAVDSCAAGSVPLLSIGTRSVACPRTDEPVLVETLELEA
jgi:putative spermidine/putrescine transport system ATP-binding protein